MVLETIACDVPGCAERHTETHYGEGHPDWGAVEGVQLASAPHRLQPRAHLCPRHVRGVMDTWLNPIWTGS